ncbi:MAG: MATE family efflux transporter [Candidatus Marinimicrobia bacterium]|nr:MATE family efflux transporter [Candidatus Neomarinimicrobiota bacterium]
MKSNQGQNQSKLSEFLDNPRRALWRLSLPVLGGMAIHTLYSITDMMFVGWVGENAIAALAFNMPLLFFAFGMTMGLASGVTAVLARVIGADDKTSADNTAEHAVAMGLFLGTGLSLAGFIIGPQMLSLAGAEGEVHSLAWAYFRIVCASLPFLVMASFFRGILTGEGDTMRPMKIMGVGTILNIILDPIMIFGLDLGVVGAAVATFISQLAVFVIFIYLVIFRKSTYVRFRLRNFSFNPSIFGAILQIGVPASLSFILMSAGAAIFNKILSTYSFQAVAAYQIAGRLEMLVLMPIIAIATGCVTLVGMFFGAAEYDKLREIVRLSISRAVTIGLIAGVIIYVSAPLAMKVFRASPEILGYGVSYLRVVAFIFPLIPLGMMSGRIMQGMGRGLPMLVLTTLRVVGLSAPLAIYFSQYLHKPVVWVWYSMFISAVVASFVGITWLINMLRKVEDLPVPAGKQDEPPDLAPEVAG